MKKKIVHPVVQQMMDDKARIEQQLRAGKPLKDIGIKIVSPLAVPTSSAT